MNITDLKSGDDIVITLLRTRPANPVQVKGDIIHRTKNEFKRTPRSFTGGEGIVLANADKILTIRFTSNTASNFEGVAELEYEAIRDIHIWEGETNADTVVLKRKLDFELEIPVEFPHTMPATKIYKKKVNLLWTDTK
tara:strand:- start:182 stop:595 length:414 start_codon:yes stop_codon:yes gene_type:complete